MTPMKLDPMTAWPFPRPKLTDEEWLRRAAIQAAKYLAERAK